MQLTHAVDAISHIIPKMTVAHVAPISVGTAGEITAYILSFKALIHICMD